jgi:hypothetical protein
MIIIMYVILTGVLANMLFGQIIHLKPVLFTPQQLQLNVLYSGPPQPVSAISLTIKYDTSLYTFDSAVLNGKYDTVGIGIITTPAFAAIHQTIRLGWAFFFVDDTVILDKDPIFTMFFTAVQDGCTLFDFDQFPPENCEIADIDLNVIPMLFSDTLICNISSGITTVNRPPNKPSVMRNILGQEIAYPKGYYILNRKLYYR